MNPLLGQLCGNLIVSCQPVSGGAMDRPDIVAAYALAVLNGGAVALRIEGVENVRAVRSVCSAPVIGLIKRDLASSPVRITPFVQDIRALVEAGANIIAFDATNRPHPEPINDLVATIHSLGALAMADCATKADAVSAAALGVAILGTTMSGYTGGEIPKDPDLALVTELSTLGRFVIAEGRYHMPMQAAQAMRAGASAVVIGSAITRPEHITSWFSQAVVVSAQDIAKKQANAL